MYNNDAAFKRRVIALGVSAVLLLICFTVYFARPNSYAPVSYNGQSYNPPLTNPELLHNWLPAASYAYTIKNIDSFLETNGIDASSMTIKNNQVSAGLSGYSFTLTFAPQGQSHSVVVSMANSGGTISTAVVIDGQIQSQQAQTNNSAGTQFAGTDALISAGVSTQQVNEVEQAFAKYAPDASYITIDAASLSHQVDSDTGSNIYTFTLTIDSKTYQAQVNCPDFDSIELLLTNQQTNKQVFDSGVIGD